MRSHLLCPESVRPTRVRSRAVVLAGALAIAACDAEPEPGAAMPETGPHGRAATFTCAPEGAASDPFADCVDELAPEGGVSFGHDALPAIVLGPPMGGGETTGSTHVASLGCGGSITLAFDGPAIADGPGPDLVIFENAFVAGEQQFVEPARVLVSEDGRDWYAFACDPPSGEGCAGIEPVLATDSATALDPATSGGDLFDLQDLGLSAIRWVRIVDATREHYGDDTWCAGSAGGFDLDAVARVEAG
jgi:hypothetical protein